ncbi:TasA family protein [Peribacillus acanthi]|uniref:TasA family protein n=1 Tax=Peribacillus acanthi TaxID=2171554 RepID=UPI001300976C|nr:TasA family protein [Peribacillus acanthi]
MPRKKLATIVVTGALAVSLAVGGATYAIFTDSATNAGNTFTAGTINMDGHRQDIPIEGPMFYTQDNDSGRMGTGFWAPKDIHTRGIFFENKGSLTAKLSKISATASVETPPEFTSQAVVTIAALRRQGGGEMDATAIKNLNEALDQAFKAGLSSRWSWIRNGARLAQEQEAVAREFALNKTFVVKNVFGFDVSVFVEDIYTDELKDLVSSGGVDVKSKNIQVSPRHTLYMGYTVTLPDLGIANNPIMGKSVNIDFTNEFQQARNN